MHIVEDFICYHAVLTKGIYSNNQLQTKAKQAFFFIWKN